MHPDIDSLMMRALDDELNPAEQHTLQSHLAGCAACASAWQSLQTIHQQLSAAPLQAPTADFADRVLQHIVAHQRTTAHQPRISHWLLFALSATAVALLSVSLSPVGEWGPSFTWSSWLGDAISISTWLTTGWSALTTCARVLAQIVGAGPLTLSALVMLVLTIVWSRMVMGSFQRVVLFTGGIR